MATGIKVTVGMIVYYAVLFAFFFYLPPSDIIPTGGNFNQTSIGFGNVTGEDTAASQANSIVDTLFSVVTFDVQGVNPVVRFFVATIPALLMVLGIYGLVRGI